MKFLIIYPKVAIPLEERIKINENEWELKKIKDMPPLGKGAEIREIEYYWDRENNDISYIIQDKKENGKLVGRESFFSEGL
jgi:hypothetical protein